MLPSIGELLRGSARLVCFRAVLLALAVVACAPSTRGADTPPIFFGAPQRVAPFHLGAGQWNEKPFAAVSRGASVDVLSVRQLFTASATQEIRLTPVGADGEPNPYAARVLTSGSRIREAAADDIGDHALVAWIDGDVLRVAPLAGESLGTAQVLSMEAASVRIACNGARGLIVWSDTSGVGEIVRDAVVDAEGNVRATGSLVSSGSIRSVAADPSGFLLLASTSSPQLLRAIRIDAATAGVVFDVPVLAEASFSAMAAEFDGTDYALTWTTELPDARANSPLLYGQKLSTSGQLSASHPITRLQPSGAYILRLLMRWNGSEHLVVASYEVGGLGRIPEIPLPEGITALPIDRNLQPLHEPVIVERDENANEPVRPSWNGESFFLPYATAFLTIFPPYAPRIARLSASGEVATSRPLAIGPQSQLGAAVGAGRSGALVGWNEIDASTNQRTLYARRLDTNGTAIGEPLVLAHGGTFAIDRHGIAARGDDFLVTWTQDLQHSRAALVRGSDGEVSSVDIGALDGPLQVASDANGWLIAANRGPNLVVVRVSATGLILTPEPIRIAAAAANVLLVSDGSRFLLTWFQAVETGSGGGCVIAPDCIEQGQHYAILSGDGSMIVPDRRLLDAIAVLDVAAGPHQFAAVYAAAGRMYRLLRVDEDGTVTRFGNGAPYVEPYIAAVSLIRLSNRWLVRWLTYGGENRGAFLDDVAPATQPPSFSLDIGGESLEAIAATGDGGAISIYDHLTDGGAPLGSAVALVARTLHGSAPRMRASGHP